MSVAAAMDADARLTDVPRILLSSSLDRSGADRRPPGFAAQWTKPLCPSDVVDGIGRLLDCGGDERRDEERAAAPAAAEAPPVAASVRGRVLLAEDNEINQLIACEMLSRSGFNCTVARNGREAIERVTSEPFDLVLMDCQMSEMDGFEASREIRRLERSGALGVQRGRLPIIALTANALSGDRERCLEAGMDDFTTKPIDLSRLLAIIGGILGPDAARRAA